MITTNKNIIAACSKALGISVFPLLSAVCILTLSETPIPAQEVGTDKSSAAKSSDAKSSAVKTLTPQEWKTAVAHYNEAVELQEGGFYEHAIFEYQSALAIDDRMLQAWSNLAAVYVEQKNFSKAIKCFEKAVSIDPKRSEQWNAYANALWALHRKAEAIEKCRHAVELNPADSVAVSNLTSMLKDAGRAGETQEMLEKASTKRIGGIHESEGPIAAQAVSAEKPSRYQPSTEKFSLDKFLVHRSSTDKFRTDKLGLANPGADKPIADKPKPIADKPEPVADKPEPVANKPEPVANKPPKPSADKPGADKPIAARSSTGKLLTQQEWKNAVAHYNKGVEFHQTGYNNHAITEYRAAIAIYDRMRPAWSNLAGVYMGQKSFLKAIECFEKALSIDPKTNRSEEWDKYATALWCAHKKAEAIEKSRHAIELNPSDFYAARTLAFMLKEAGRFEDSQAVLDKASRLTKDGAEVLEPLEPGS